jgi:GH35 family endo-1,4-beta-xylanase
VADAQVEAKLVNHVFAFGTALNQKVFPGGTFGDDDSEKYLANAEQLFNAGVLENAMKWPLFVLDGFPERADLVVDWMADRDWYIRGHTVVWANWRRSPDFVRELKDDPAALAAAVDERITSIMTRYRGRVDAWDVINEPFVNREIMDVLGDEVMDHWMRLARETDPDAKLFINENGFLSNPSPKNPRSDYYHDLIAGMKSRGVPVDGLGMQGHFTGELPSMDHVLATLDRFAEVGIRIELTEVDVDAGDKELEARFLRDLMTVAFSHESVDAFILWGFWADRHWRPDAALLNRDFSKRPTATAWLDLLDEWTTRAEAITDTAGTADFRGFHGDYEIKITANGRTQTHNARLTADDADARIVLD